MTNKHNFSKSTFNINLPKLETNIEANSSIPIEKTISQSVVEMENCACNYGDLT